MKKLFLSIVVLACTIQSAKAQFLTTSNINFYNPLSLNPGYAGSGNSPYLFIQHNSVFTGVKGAPTLQSITLNAPYKPQANFGLMAQNFTTGNFKRTSVDLSYAYRLKVFNEQTLNFGVSAGFHNYSFAANSAVFFDGDELLLQSNISGISAVLGAGLVYEAKKFNLGVSFPALYANRAFLYNALEQKAFNPTQEWNFFGTYTFTVKENFHIKPTAVVRQQFNAPFVIDGFLNADYKEMIYAGVGYRYDQGMLFHAGTNILNKLALFYAFQYNNNPLMNVTNGSHEVGIKYNFKGDGLGIGSTVNQENHSTKVEQFILQHKRERERILNEKQDLRERKLQLKRERLEKKKNGKYNVNVYTQGGPQNGSTTYSSGSNSTAEVSPSSSRSSQLQNEQLLVQQKLFSLLDKNRNDIARLRSELGLLGSVSQEELAQAGGSTQNNREVSFSPLNDMYAKNKAESEDIMNKIDSYDAELEQVLRKFGELQNTMVTKADLEEINRKIDELLSRNTANDKITDYVTVEEVVQQDGQKQVKKSFLESGYYVIIESERTYEDVLKAQHDLLLNGVKTQIIQNVRKTWYHLATEKLENRDMAGKITYNWRTKGYNDAWWLFL